MEEFLKEHAMIVVSFVALLISIIGFFSVRALKQIDNSQNLLAAKLDADIKEVNTRVSNLERQFFILRGEHNIEIGRGGHVSSLEKENDVNLN